MQHLNYCRQAVKHLSWNAEHHGSPQVRSDCAVALHRIRGAQKFIIPSNGRVMPDVELRGLDGTELRLPFQTIAIEFVDREGNGRITLAWETADLINMVHIVRLASEKDIGWTPTCLLSMPTMRYIDASGVPVVSASDGECPDMLAHESWAEVLSLLNALACSNVRIELSPAKAVHKAMRKKGALPFDDYHILTIDVPGRGQGDGLGQGGHRSPREHLRRGHIRRLEDGRKLWINATVVNPGIGGKVSKDYHVRA